MTVLQKLGYALAALVCVALLAIAALYVAYDATLFAPERGARRDVVIRGGMLFDAVSTAARANPGLVLRDGVIACIGADCTAPAGALEIDASGLAILPGFVDLHRHFFGSRASSSMLATIWNTARMMPGKRRKLLEAGVTSIRQVGDPRDAILEVKRMLEARELAGPRLFVAGPIFTAPGGHPAYGGRDPNPSGIGGPMTFQSDDAAAVRAEVARLAALGVDGIKAVLHGNVSPDGSAVLPTLSAPTFEALVAAAKAHDLWIAVHVGPAEQASQAARAGATTVEHGVRSGNRVDAATVEALVANRVVYVATLGQEPDGHLAIPPLQEAGVLFGVGTDEGDYHDELGRLAAAGVPPAEVLVAATRNAAIALHREHELGTLEQGKRADIVLVRGAPWDDVAAARAVVTVVQEGYVLLDKR